MESRFKKTHNRPGNATRHYGAFVNTYLRLRPGFLREPLDDADYGDKGKNRARDDNAR